MNERRSAIFRRNDLDLHTTEASYPLGSAGPGQAKVQNDSKSQGRFERLKTARMRWGSLANDMCLIGEIKLGNLQFRIALYDIFQ